MIHCFPVEDVTLPNVSVSSPVLRHPLLYLTTSVAAASGRVPAASWNLAVCMKTPSRVYMFFPFLADSDVDTDGIKKVQTEIRRCVMMGSFGFVSIVTGVRHSWYAT